MRLLTIDFCPWFFIHQPKKSDHGKKQKSQSNVSRRRQRRKRFYFAFIFYKRNRSLWQKWCAGRICEKEWIKHLMRCFRFIYPGVFGSISNHFSAQICVNCRLECNLYKRDNNKIECIAVLSINGFGSKRLMDRRGLLTVFLQFCRFYLAIVDQLLFLFLRSLWVGENTDFARR